MNNFLVGKNTLSFKTNLDQSPQAFCSKRAAIHFIWKYCAANFHQILCFLICVAILPKTAELCIQLTKLTSVWSLSSTCSAIKHLADCIVVLSSCEMKINEVVFYLFFYKHLLVGWKTNLDARWCDQRIIITFGYFFCLFHMYWNSWNKPVNYAQITGEDLRLRRSA